MNYQKNIKMNGNIRVLEQIETVYIRLCIRSNRPASLITNFIK
jgi:hypothetical protein